MNRPIQNCFTDVTTGKSLSELIDAARAMIVENNLTKGVHIDPLVKQVIKTDKPNSYTIIWDLYPALPKYTITKEEDLSGTFL